MSANDRLAQLAHEIATRHQEIRHAGIFWAECLGIEGEHAEPFIQSFGARVVESLMQTGRVPSQGYNLDVQTQQQTSPILLAACRDVGVDPSRLPDNVSMHISNLTVSVHRGDFPEPIWTISEEARAALCREWYGNDFPPIADTVNGAVVPQRFGASVDRDWLDLLRLTGSEPESPASAHYHCDNGQVIFAAEGDNGTKDGTGGFDRFRHE